MKQELRALLDHLQRVLNAARQAMIETRHRRALNWEPVDRLPVIAAIPAPEELRFVPYPHREVFEDPEKMLFNELVYAFGTSIASRDVLADDLPCTIRANFGTVVIASLFGARVVQIGDNPPWVRHEADHAVSLESVLDHDPLDFSQGWCPRIVERYRFYHHILADYPELKRLIRVVLPDLQGPFDTLELIIGSNVFAELYSSQDLIGKALDAIATAQIGFARYLEPYVDNESDPFSYQHATMIKGRILIRDDSVILMSPAMYQQVAACFDERVMRDLGSGGIHCCGRADSHVPAFLELPSIRCLDLGQSELNDIQRIYEQLKKRQIPLTRLKVSREELATARINDRFPTGVSLLYEASSVVDAMETIQAYARASDKRRNGPADPTDG